MPPCLCGSRCDSPGRTPCRHAAWRRPLAPSTPQHRRWPRRGPARAPAQRNAAPRPRSPRGERVATVEKFQPSSSTAEAAGPQTTAQGSGPGRNHGGCRGGGPRTREKGQAERPGGGGAGSPSGRSAGAGGAGAEAGRTARARGVGADSGGPGERPGSRGWRAAATYLRPGPTAAPPRPKGCRRRGAQAPCAGRWESAPASMSRRAATRGHDAAGALARCSPPGGPGTARPEPLGSPCPAPPAWLTAPASSRQARLRASTNRCRDPPAAACSNRARAPPPPLRPATNGQREPSQARPALGATETSDWPVVGDVGSSSLIGIRLGAPCAIEERQQGWGGAEGAAERGRGEDAGVAAAVPELPEGRGGFGHRDCQRAGPGWAPARPCCWDSRRAGWRLPSDRRCAAADWQEGPRSQAPRVPGGGRGLRMPSRDGTEGLGPGR